MTEMEKLIQMLEDANIPHEVDVHELTGTLMVLYPSAAKCVCDAVCHEFSYGYSAGLLEIMGLCEDAGDEVLGWLTAEDVFQRIKTHYEGVGKDD